MSRISMVAVAAALGLMLAAGTTQAQLYRYKDANGSMVYSDSPPPPGTPPGNILKAPKIEQPPPPADTSATGKGPDGKDKKTGQKSVAEQEADYKKRKAEEEKKAKADADKAALEQQRQAQCTSLQTNLAALQSGQRMKTFDAQGNPSFLDDAGRDAAIAKAQQDMASAKCN
jgi:hypothetical protein